MRIIDRWLARVTGMVGVVALSACAPDAPAPLAPEPSLAKGAPGGGAPAVSSTVPSYGRRGTTLDVRVFGSGFTAGATAEWAYQGVKDPTQVRTNSTTFVSSSELVANITIADGAELAYWDVAVALLGGKNGIGTELFEISTAVEIGTLGGNTQVYGMNDAGQLVGWSFVGTTQTAFIWEPSSPGATAGTMRALSPGTAWDIDEEGATVVGVSAGRAAIWTLTAGGWPTVAEFLPATVGGSTATAGNARAIVTLDDGSGDQAIAGYLDFAGAKRSTVRRAVVWRRAAGGAWSPPIALPSPTGSTSTFAVDLARELTVVGNSPDAGGNSLGGPVWTYGNGAWALTARLPALPGDDRGTPTAIDPSGSIIVGESAAGNGIRAVFWTGSGATWQASELPAAANSGRALDVSATGLVVGQGAYWQVTGTSASAPSSLSGIGNRNAPGAAHAVNASGTRAAGGQSTNSRGLLWVLP